MTDATSIMAKEKGNKELSEALLSPEGPLGAGIMPAVETGGEDGQKKLLEAMDAGATATKIKAKRNTGAGNKAEEALPKTLDESMSQLGVALSTSNYEPLLWLAVV